MQTLHILLPLDLTATAVGALSGSLVARRQHFDIIGMFFLALVSGLGGGIIRDVLLGRLPPAALTLPAYLFIILGAMGLVALLETLVRRTSHVLFVLDAASLGLFACVGAQLSIATGLAWPAAMLIGCLNAVGGGILRDLLMSKTVQILLPGPLLASAVFLGCGLYLALTLIFHLDIYLAWGIAVVFIFLIRVIGAWRKWSLPEPRDLTTLSLFNGERKPLLFSRRTTRRRRPKDSVR